ncbi:hypothetical protein THIOSC15_3110005 [uncultured Thiomicrorhabdus sp.]
MSLSDEDIPRCQVTHNICGTDTWAKDKYCTCLACRGYVYGREALEQDLTRVGNQCTSALGKWRDVAELNLKLKQELADIHEMVLGIEDEPTRAAVAVFLGKKVRLRRDNKRLRKENERLQQRWQYVQNWINSSMVSADGVDLHGLQLIVNQALPEPPDEPDT